MEKHQILRPRQARGTPAQTILFKLGVAGIISTIVGFFVSDYFRGRRHEERIQSGAFLLPDHIRWNNLMMSQLKITDMNTAATIRRRQDESEIDNLEKNSNTAPFFR